MMGCDRLSSCAVCLLYIVLLFLLNLFTGAHWTCAIWTIKHWMWLRLMLKASTIHTGRPYRYVMYCSILLWLAFPFPVLTYCLVWNILQFDSNPLLEGFHYLIQRMLATPIWSCPCPLTRESDELSSFSSTPLLSKTCNESCLISRDFYPDRSVNSLHHEK